MSRRLLACSVALLGLAFAGLAVADPKVPAVPPTPHGKVVDLVYGVAVPDPYRWLEETNKPELRTWLREQNRRTRATLDQGPFVKALRGRLIQLLADSSDSYEKVSCQDGRFFALRGGDLVVFDSPDAVDEARVVLDPSDKELLRDEAFKAPDGPAPEWLWIDSFFPSPDGKKVAVAIAADGGEEGHLRVVEVDSGKTLPDRLPLVTTPEGGFLAWNPDNSGFWYTRHPRGKAGEPRYLHQQVWYHKLGTKPDEDTYLIGKGDSPISQWGLDVTDDGRHLLLSRNDGLGREQDVYLVTDNGRPVQVATQADRVTLSTVGPDETILLISYKDAPRGRLLTLPLAKPHFSAARELIPQGDWVLVNVFPAETRLYLRERWGGEERLRVCDTDGKEVGRVPLPPHVSVREVVVTEGDEVLLRLDSYLAPTDWRTYDPAKGKFLVTKMREKASFHFKDAELVRESARSADGTPVPMTILRKKGCEKDGSHPVYLTAYGGFGHDLEPVFDPCWRIWLDSGGVVVVAHLRGDGEFGDDWHRAATLTAKQRTFDDLIACARYLVETKYTVPGKLGLSGGSNGGLTVGAVLTQAPELFGAVVCEVGFHDMTRIEILQGGRSCVPEYGSVKDPEQFRAMFAYSPYHTVRDGVAYPPTLLRTGLNDGRVSPVHSWKMAARMQAATKGPGPVLLWTSMHAGHNDAPSEGLTRAVDLYAFLYQNLGIKPPAAPAADE